MQDTSASLLNLAARNGDGDAWRRLEEIYAPLLQSWLRRYDLLQDVLQAGLASAREANVSQLQSACRSSLLR